jgi:hypothetical protein
MRSIKYENDSTFISFFPVGTTATVNLLFLSQFKEDVWVKRVCSLFSVFTYYLFFMKLISFSAMRIIV